MRFTIGYLEPPLNLTFNGNKNIALRGRQSFSTQADTVLWDIDGLIFNAPPPLDINQVQYVESPKRSLRHQ